MSHLLVFSLIALFTSAACDQCCDDGWFHFGKNCYRIFYHKQSWADANSTCHSFNGTLFIPNSMAEWQLVTENIPLYNFMWMGLKSISGFFWTKSSGLNISILPWLVKNPTTFGHFIGFDCAAFYNPGQKTPAFTHWYTCKANYNFICQKVKSNSDYTCGQIDCPSGCVPDNNYTAIDCLATNSTAENSKIDVNETVTETMIPEYNLTTIVAELNLTTVVVEYNFTTVVADYNWTTVTAVPTTQTDEASL
ncbi:C-type lectin domain-containing protein 91 [Trichinella sp. T6]|nr:C-type lectin domain-containing protein 91 [Trichinella sp. T6]